MLEAGARKMLRRPFQLPLGTDGEIMTTRHRIHLQESLPPTVHRQSSRNLLRQAIGHSPTDATRTFRSSGMDALARGSFLVEK